MYVKWTKYGAVLINPISPVPDASGNKCKDTDFGGTRAGGVLQTESGATGYLRVGTLIYLHKQW